MTTTTSRSDRPLQAACLAALCAAVFIWLLIRNHGLGPAIFADEWYYSKMSRLLPVRDAFVPSYLYLWIFRSTNACGTGFLDCVRIGNELFFVGAAPFFYLVARRVMSRWLALYVVLLSLLAPTNLYTSFFMPESTYWFGFAVLSWVVLCWRDDAARQPWRALAAGAVLGLMSLVKVHALFILPALCLYLVGAAWLRAKPRWLAGGLRAALLAVTAMLAVKFGLGYLMAGDAALSLFGRFYSAAASSHAGRPLAQLLRAASISGLGHLMALAVLLGLPLALLLQALLGRNTSDLREPGESALRQIQLYALLMLAATAGMTVLYTASISNAGDDEVLRLHLRYYSFVFPLLLVVAAGALGKRPAPAWPFALAVAAVLALAAWQLPAYTPTAIDGPDIHAVQIGQPAGLVLIGAELLILLAWACRSRLAVPLFLFAAVPWMTWLGATDTWAYLSQISPAWPPAEAGRFAYRYVPLGEHKQITVATTGITEVMRTQFFIDDPDTSTLDLPKDAPITPYQLPARNKWLLVVGHHPLPAGIQPVVQTADYALVKLDTRRRSIGTAQFNQALPNDLVQAAEGLSYVEPWGRWSDTGRVVLHFSRPLPTRARVVLKAQAFGPNTGLPFTMRIGAQRQQFRVTELPQEVALIFGTDGRQRSLTIDIPRPTAPHDVGPSVDIRTIGLGLSEIEVSALD